MSLTKAINDLSELIRQIEWDDFNQSESKKYKAHNALTSLRNILKSLKESTNAQTALFNLITAIKHGNTKKLWRTNFLLPELKTIYKLIGGKHEWKQK